MESLHGCEYLVLSESVSSFHWVKPLLSLRGITWDSNERTYSPELGNLNCGLCSEIHSNHDSSFKRPWTFLLPVRIEARTCMQMSASIPRNKIQWIASSPTHLPLPSTWLFFRFFFFRFLSFSAPFSFLFCFFFFLPQIWLGSSVAVLITSYTSAIMHVPSLFPPQAACFWIINHLYKTANSLR